LCRLDDASLEPTHVLVGTLPVNGMPIHPLAGSCTSSRSCRYLLCLLSPFAERSRQERPDGSLPAFAWDDVAQGSIPIQTITVWRWLAPSSSTRWPITTALRRRYLKGDQRAYRVPPLSHRMS
jgi:hypothetical protein